MHRSPAAAAVAAVCAIVLSACGFVAGGAAPSAGTGTPGAPVATLAPPPGTILSANSTAQLGTVVVDGLGHTLYRSDRDSARPPASTCAGDCASTWTPVPASEPLTVEGIDRSDIGTVVRPDGTGQVTIGGWPVYRYAADPAPGATEGHGVGGTWFAVTPDGGKAQRP